MSRSCNGWRAVDRSNYVGNRARGFRLGESDHGREKLMANPRKAWVEDFSDPAIRTIGGLEFLGALGLILPAVTGIAPILVPLAAVGLAITMFGAIVVHVRRGDGTLSVVVPLVLGLTAIFVAWGRFGAYAF